MHDKNTDKRIRGDDIWKILDNLGGRYPTWGIDTFFIIYLLFRHIKDELNIKYILEREENPDTRNILDGIFQKYLHNKEDRLNSMNLLSNFDNDVIEQSLINADFLTYQNDRSRFEFSSADSAIKLANAIMKPRVEDEVADFCSGCGSFLMANARNNVNNLTGVEINPTSNAVADIRLSLLKDREKNFDYKLYNMDLFKYSQDYPEAKYDRIFSQFPWGMRMDFPPKEYWVSQFPEGTVLPTNSDWYFLHTVISHLKYSGKACVLATQSIEFRQPDESIRKYFLDQGHIEQVIQLPDNFHPGTSIPTMMLVLSFNNKEIRFFDASTTHSGDLRQKFFSDEDVAAIMDDNNPNCNYVSYDNVIRAARLMPAFFTAPVIKDGKPLGEVAEIFRGQYLRKHDLDQLLSKDGTDVELIRPKHIKNGMIVDVDYLQSLPPNAKLLQADDILLTRVGTNIDSALYEANPEVTSIVDDNIMVIRCESNKINVNYLLAYFQSDAGMEQLRVNYKGSAIMRINVSDLRKLPIPMLTKREQDTIGKEFGEITEVIENNRLALTLSLEGKSEQLQQWFGR
jgi:hypothetical protein